MGRGRVVAGLSVLVLLLVSACSWPMGRYGPGRTGHNPFESTLSTANVATLTTDFTGPLAPTLVDDAPVVVNDLVFVGQDDTFAAFSADGDDGCSGSPGACTPRWSAATDGDVSGSAAIGNDVVYVGSAGGTFAAGGVTNCAGTPTVCQPLWTASTDGAVRAPLVANGRVYVTTSGGALAVFDAAGQVGCGGSPRTCEPLWTASVADAASPPALAGGTVYFTAGMTLYAFDAAGVTNCSSTAHTCAPRWTATPDCFSVIGCSVTAPAVEGGTVFFGADQSDEFPRSGTLYAYDAAGVVGCGGVPRACEPRWTAGTRAQYSPPAVANGRVYVADHQFDDFDFTSESRVVAFDAAGVSNCGGTPTFCTPLWASDDTDGGASVAPSVANGVVYAFGGDSLLAFDAAGSLGCSGVPVVCAPVGTFGSFSSLITSPAIANGRVYIGEAGGLRAFALPS